MWAIGVILYILLCGFPPFRSAERRQTELFEFIKKGEFEFLSPYWDSNSEGMNDLIIHILKPELLKVAFISVFNLLVVPTFINAQSASLRSFFVFCAHFESACQL